MNDPRLKRLKFRAWRRGFKEADLILGRFADRRLAELSRQDLDRFEALLDEPDHDLYAWIIGAEPVPARHDHALFHMIRAFKPAEAGP